ncbi:hypothetical protein DXJ76_07995 [Vibrio parahaemolyticus]|nr:hypothetical protein DXJ76_07995 [Vibrio parahaemolyticus]
MNRLRSFLSFLEKYSHSLTETIYITLPILVLVIIKVVSGQAASLIETSDTSIASCIVFGQLAVKYESISSYKGEKKHNRHFFSNVMRSFMMVSLILYVCMQSIDNIEPWVYYVGHAWFAVSLLLHLFFSQLAEDLKNRIRKS